MGEAEPTRQYIIDGIAQTCRRFRGRSAGSEAEAGCQRYFAGQLRQWADEVSMEPFSVHPKAFMGWIVVDGILALTATALYWMQLCRGGMLPVTLATTFVTIAVLLFVFEFLFYRQIIDLLFPSAVSHNVYAVRHSRGSCERRIIFGGHADAAYEMTFCHRGGKWAVYTVIAGAASGLAVYFCASLALLIRVLTSDVPLGLFWTVLGYIQLLFVPFFAAALMFVNWRRVVDGANDNLSACFAAMGVLRRMAGEDLRLQNTEVCCLITGAEESGLRGALAFASGHRRELTVVPTVFIALDTLRETRKLMVYLCGQSGTQKNDHRVGNLLQQAAKNKGLHLSKAPVYLGATDAEAFSRHGLPACGLCGVDHNPQPYYHTRADTCDNIDADCIETILNLCLEAAKQYDEAGGLDVFS